VQAAEVREPTGGNPNQTNPTHWGAADTAKSCRYWVDNFYLGESRTSEPLKFLLCAKPDGVHCENQKKDDHHTIEYGKGHCYIVEYLTDDHRRNPARANLTKKNHSTEGGGKRRGAYDPLRSNEKH